MHRFSRSAGALTAVTAVSVLTMAGCGSSTKSVSGTGTPATSAATTSASGPAGVSGPASSTGPAISGGPTSPAGSTNPTSPASPADPSTAPSTATFSPAGVPGRSICPGLVEKLGRLHGVASGTTFSDLVATNDGAATCTLPAQPDLQYLDARHQPLRTGFSPDPQLKPYNLAPGASAVMVVAYGSDGNYPCVPIGFVRIAAFHDELAVTGRTHCEHDSSYEEGWVAGTYTAPH